MVRVSNALIAIVNVITLLGSILLIASPIWLHSGSICEKAIQKPLLIVGVAVLIVSIFGIIGSCCKVQFVMYIYQFVMFVLIIGVLCFMIFAIVVTNKGVGKAISGRGYKEYRLGDYSHWLQKYVINDENWHNIRSCLVDAKVCHGLGVGHNSAAEFYMQSLSPTESGCCKPPTYCGFEFQNATFWTLPKSGPAVPDSDCTTWSNNQNDLCFDCKSCKAGVLANIKHEWRELAIINGVIFVVCLLIYSIGCCALRSNKADRYYKHRSYA